MVKRPQDTTKGTKRLAREQRHAWHQRLTRNLRERNHAGGKKPLDNVELMHEIAKIVHIEVEAEAKEEIAAARRDGRRAALADVRRAVESGMASGGGILSASSMLDVLDRLADEARS